MPEDPWEKILRNHHPVCLIKCQWDEWFANRIQCWSVFGYVQLFKCFFFPLWLSSRVKLIQWKFPFYMCGNQIVSNYFILRYWTRTKKKKQTKNFSEALYNRKKLEGSFVYVNYHPSTNEIEFHYYAYYYTSTFPSSVGSDHTKNTHGKHYMHHRILLIEISACFYSYFIYSLSLCVYSSNI